jgi:hypothetical protein
MVKGNLVVRQEYLTANGRTINFVKVFLLDIDFYIVGKNINSIARVSLSNFPYYHTFRTMEGTLEEKN